MKRLTNLALTRFYQRISDLNGCDLYNQISFKLTTLNRSVNSLFSMILPRFELEWHPYQERTLPIKLKNLINSRALRFELRTRSLKLLVLPIKLYSSKISKIKSEKRWFEHLCANYTIFSKYLALPIATLPRTS